MSFDFKGKLILVTGASRGIGRALAKALVGCGAIVYALARSKDDLDSLVQECGKNILPIVADLTEWEATRTQLENLPALHGVVNNAGTALPWKSSLDVNKEACEDLFALNVYGALNVIQVMARKIKEAGIAGSIVNVSSVKSLSAFRDSLAYNMSKASLDTISRQFALELGPHNIRVNSVNPTLVTTPLGMRAWTNPPENLERLMFHTPLGRPAEMEDVVQPILYLLGDCSRMVTGSVHPVDGGLLSNVPV